MMHIKNALLARAAVAAVLVVAGLPAKAQIHSGSLAPPVPANELSQRVAAARAEFASVLANALSPDSVAAMRRLIKDQQNLVGGGVTNFDNVNAPCLFDQTTALLGQEQFAAFFTPPRNGGAILNECANFGVNAPELIVVGQKKTNVSLWVSDASTPGFPLAVVALGNDGVQEIVTTTTSPDWLQIILTGAGIEAIALVGDPMVLLVDDIEAQ
jgi:hypothetical protein